MRAALALLLICLFTPLPAFAGAWLRGEGESFLSLTGSLRQAGSAEYLETDLYAEHGLGPRLTAGLAYNDTGGDSGHALAFLRLPLGRRDGPARLSVELGLGAHHRQGQWRPMQRLALAYGRGLTWPGGTSWLNLETALERRRGLPDPEYKIDLTLGQSGGARLRPMIKLGSSHTPDQRLGWSASAYLLFDGPEQVTWTVGLERKRAGRLSTALILGLWRRF